MGDKAKNSELKGKISKNIKNLYLDPNNYRFVDDLNYENVNDEKLTDEKVQRRTRNFIEGPKRERIRDLIDSFKSNGYLKVDVIQLRDLGDNHFLVIEGNRRVAALKCLQEDFNNGLSIGKLDPQVFSSVPSEINDEKDGLDHLIIMGLKHISGNKKWAAINQAQLIYDYLTKYWSDKKEYQAKEIELCNSLGISKSKLRNSQRAYHLINSYKESDYGDQFTSNMYSIFEEVMKKPVFRNWLDWDDDMYFSKNRVNEQRLFSWLSTSDAVEGDEEEGEEDHISEPIITKALEVRDLAGFITNEKMLVSMEKWHNIGRAMLENGTDNRLSIDKSIEAVVENIRTIRRYADVLEEEDLAQLEDAEKELGVMIPRSMISELSSNGANVCFSVGKIKHYSKLQVEKFKKISGLQIDDLRRINIFAGPNNSGKTTILEAVYLLCLLRK